MANRYRKDVEVTGPAVFDDGRNNRFMNMVNPDLYLVTLGEGAFHGVKQNGAQIDPDNPPANITITGRRECFAGPGHSTELKEPLPKAVQILAVLEQGGDDALLAYGEAIDILQANGGDLLDLSSFLAIYDAALGNGNLTYAKAMFKHLAVAVMGQEWADARTNEQLFEAAQAFIRGKTRDQLLGKDTEVVEVIS